jgi:ribosomal protein S17
MKSKVLFYMAAVLLVLCLAAPTMADTVAQGKCVSYDQDKKIIVIEDYDTNFSKENKYGKPTGKQSTYNVANALIGATPAAGDILRIAFEEKGADRVAVRVMNVSKQDLMKK